MQIQQMSIKDIKPYPNNPRKNDKAVDKVAQSIETFGFNQPIVVDRDNIIIVGHTRFKAAQKIGLIQVPVLRIDDVSDEKIQAYRLADNKLNELATWDEDMLAEELNQISEIMGDIDLTGFSEYEQKTLNARKSAKDDSYKSLSEKYLYPPFSVLEAKSGEWQKRKKDWMGLGLRSELGREAGLTFGTSEFNNIGDDKSTSVFDPFLCELMVTWFSDQGHKILDPFAGGSVRGVVSAMCARDYIGIDLRDEQIQANKQQWNEIKQVGYPLATYNYKAEPEWITGDSNEQLNQIPSESVDLIMTCPPYADLEVYSDDPKDISNMDYDDFKHIYSSILTKSVSKLRDDRFAVIVIGEARDKAGNYYNLIGDTIDIMKKAGCHLYNELILVTPLGNLNVRAERPFKATRKVGKTHQNALVFLKGEHINQHDKALVFVKGTGKLAADHAGRIEVDSTKLVFMDDAEESL